MADSFIQMPGDGTGKKVRTQSRVVGVDTVHESYVINTDPTDGSAAAVKNVPPGASDYGMVVRRVDPARTQRNFQLVAFATTATADTMMSITPITGFASAAAATSFAITAGKTFRIQAIMAAMRLSSAATHYAQIRVRVNTNGAVTTASPIIANILLPAPAALANAGIAVPLDIPEGLDVPASAGANVQIGFSVQTSLIATVVDCMVMGYEY